MKFHLLQVGRSRSSQRPVNWFGLLAGISMLILPFLGYWWHAAVGKGAAELALSPFDYHMSFAGWSISSTLVGYFLLAAKLSVMVGGVLMVVASALPLRWWSKRVLKFGATTVLWMVISLLMALVAGAFFMNAVLPALLSGLIPAAGVSVQLNVPYISGTAASEIAGGGASISAPITASLTWVFWVAIAVAALGIAARIYHRRFKPPKA